MVSKDITYIDFDGKKVTNKFWFNLTPFEVGELNIEFPGGFESVIKDFDTDPDTYKLFQAFKKLILKAYGIKTPDKRFIKDEIATKEFAASDAMSELFISFKCIFCKFLKIIYLK